MLQFSYFCSMLSLFLFDVNIDFSYDSFGYWKFFSSALGSNSCMYIVYSYGCVVRLSVNGARYVRPIRCAEHAPSPPPFCSSARTLVFAMHAQTTAVFPGVRRSVFFWNRTGIFLCFDWCLVAMVVQGGACPWSRLRAHGGREGPDRAERQRHPGRFHDR